MEDKKDVHARLDAAELFDDSGLVFEVNRVILHPIGYHLGASVIAGEKILEVLDYKDVEGGIAFDAAEWKEGKEKLKVFNKRREVVRRVSARMRIFGCIIQETMNGPRASGSKDPGERRASPKPRR